MWTRLQSFVRRLFTRGAAKAPTLPALPQFPARGLRANAGDKVEIRDMRISVQDAGTAKIDLSRPVLVCVPEWSARCEGGAIFRLAQKANPIQINFDQGHVWIPECGTSIEVALRNVAQDPHIEAYSKAEQILDFLAAESYQAGAISDPLREYAVWQRESGETRLRYVTTSRLALQMQLTAVISDASGVERTQETPVRRWHPSHAYFRHSQIADNLHDAYRYLFLALEALLSELYPWRKGMSESVWLTAALMHVTSGYGLDLSKYLARPGGNPCRRFLKEQYAARRCALFHAKLTEAPIRPGDQNSRIELAGATKRLGQLYVDLARRATGAGFAGGGVTFAAFEQMVQKMMEGAEVYISQTEEFGFESLIRCPAFVERHGTWDGGVHHVIGRWDRSAFPGAPIRRAGVVLRQQGDWTDGMWTRLEVDLSGVDKFEVVIQMELVNSGNLREWFL